MNMYEFVACAMDLRKGEREPDLWLTVGSLESLFRVGEVRGRRTVAADVDGRGGGGEEIVGYKGSRLDCFGGERHDDAAEIRGLSAFLRLRRSGGATVRASGYGGAREEEEGGKEERKGRAGGGARRGRRGWLGFPGRGEG